MKTRVQGALAIAAAMLAVAAAVAFAAHRADLAFRLVATPADQAPLDPALVSYAHERAVPLFSKHCARCHGADMRGRQTTGAPNLVDNVWLYDGGGVFDIERMILYGARSGHAKARNITDMPAIGRLGVLKDDEIRDVVEYVIRLSGRPADPAAAERGQAIFKGKGNCFDCHAADGRGNPDYGSTDFTADVWNYGGERAALFTSVRDGRHGLMPAFIDTLDPAQIRALALDIYVRSHPPRTTAESAHR